MNRSIKPINRESIHSICSGQVVLDLATAVKELVENSVDAGATSVEIKFRENGVKGVEVIDNGYGVDPENYKSLTLKHYTSKINDFEDVESVETFGFRGEALSSLCSLSHLTVITCTKSQEPVGTRLEYDQSGALVSQTTVSRMTGTTVQISDLFHPLPVRQKEFKRNFKREYTKALAILQAYSIISTDIKITVTNQSENKKTTTVMSTNKNKSLMDNILNVYGSKIVSQIMPFQATLESAKGSVEGFISKPEWGMGRSSSDRQHFYINGRPCLLPKIASAFNELYRSFISNQYPLVIADFKIPTNTYDVNVSPDKRTIFVHEEKQIIEAAMDQIRALMEPSRSTFQTNCLIKTKTFDVDPDSSESSREASDMISESPTVSLQSFASNEGTAYKPKPKAALGKRQHREKRDEQLERSSMALKDFLFKKPKTIEETIPEQEMTEGNTFSIDNTEKQPRHNQENATVVVTEIDPNELQKIFSKSLEQSALMPMQKNQRMDLEEDNWASVSKDTLPTTEENEPLSKEHQVTTVEREDKARYSRGVDIIPSDSDESQYINDEHHVYVEEDEIKTLEMRSKTLGLCMTIDTENIEFPSPSSRKRAENTMDHLANQVDRVQFFSSAGVQNIKDNGIATEALNKVIHKHDFKRMQILGQFNLGFIIVSLDQDLYIIDQHASDEKYNFETLQKTVKVSSQQLIRPLTLDLTAAEEIIVMENIEIFKLNGFTVRVLQENQPTRRIQVISQPVTKRAMFDHKDFSEIVHLLTENPGEMVRCSRNRATFASMACHKAVRIGQHLKISKMIKIVRNMGEIDQPWNCPHGRPSMRHLASLDQFEKTDTSRQRLTFRGSLFK
ncbi:hypothetical protein BY458DRAFT_474099 [Sporodiniella umbellata]|nr:hypothetical protein BY458DRAFT_474099 [Sporodiniella umbellata]